MTTFCSICQRVTEVQPIEHKVLFNLGCGHLYNVISGKSHTREENAEIILSDTVWFLVNEIRNIGEAIRKELGRFEGPQVSLTTR